MTQYVETRRRTFPATTALSAHRRVKLSSGKLVYAGASDTNAIGTLDRDAYAADELVAVNLRISQGTQIMIASEAITADATVYAAANGKVAPTGTVIVGIAINAAGGDNAQVEVIESASGVMGNVARSALVQDDLKPYPIALTQFRVHDALETNLPGSAGTDDLGLIDGTYGTDAPTVQGVDFGGTTTTAYARAVVPLPAEYVAGETVTLRVRAAMLTTVADTSCFIDAQVFKPDGDGAVGSDLCATAQQSMNSLTPANFDFTVTPTGLVAGDMLDIRLRVAGIDSGNVGVMIPEITDVRLLCDIKG